MSVQQEKFKAIADRIRHYLGINDLIKPSDFADKIDAVAEDRYTLGVTDCYPRAYDEGKSAGISEGIEQGKQSANDEFWVDFISTMNSAWNSSYSIAGFGWNDKTFKPTRNFTVRQATNMFASCRITDLADILEKQGVTWSFSSCTNLNSLATYSTITRFPLLDTRSCSSLHGAFDNCTSLHTVVKIILKNDGTQTFTNTFVNCTRLANIIFEGVIGQNLDMKSSPLTKESIENVIGCLSTTTTGKTLTLNKTAKEVAFTDGEWATLIGTKSNWTISLV